MAAMVVAICELALARGMAREFSANDLKLEDHGGGGICGAVFKRLIDDQVLTRVGRFEGGVFQPKTVTNAGGNLVKVYRLASHARASSLVRIHRARPQPEFKQAELLPV